METNNKSRLDREAIAMRVAQELPDGACVNLGIGIPSLVSQYVPEGRSVTYQSENGVLNYGPLTTESDIQDPDYINAGGQFLVPIPGMSFFHLADSFVMIRGGHIDVTVLGAFQVSEKGDIANWRIPGRITGNIGGAMDLVAGAKKVIVAMEHVDKDQNPKILRTCTYPLTGQKCVSLIITDLAVIEVTHEGLLLKEIAPGWTFDELQNLTDARLIKPHGLQVISL